MKRVILGLLAATLLVPVLAQKQKEKKESAGNILLVVTNHGRIEKLDKPTGYWMSEVSHAWTRFTDAGYTVTFASPKGETVPLDPRSFDLEDTDNKRMWNRGTILELAETKPLEEVDPAKFKAVYFAGGHGTMWDFPDSESLQKVTQAIWEKGGVVSAVCHGPAGLVNVKTGDGKYLVDGKKVAAFTNAEEQATGLAEAVPFLLESKLKERGATAETAANYKEKVVVDGQLITGQNPASAAGVADAVVEALKQ